MKKMKILLISPITNNKILGGKFAFKLPFLSLVTLAAYTPDDVDVKIIDERVDTIDFEEYYDLVGITVMTPLANRAYEIAHKFKQRGIKVVMGGMHISALPDEALVHADAVVIGEGEKNWPDIIEDVENNKLKKIYKTDALINLKIAKAPNRSLLNSQKFAPVEFLETTRGCPFECHFCSVTKFFGNTYRTRTMDDVISEISMFKTTMRRFSIKNVVFFVDDNIIGRKDWAKELFQRIKPYNLNWLGQASMNIAKDDELLQLAADSGCMGLLIGFESLSDNTLKNVAKKSNRTSEYIEVIKKIQSYGIGIMGSFIFGFDEDKPDVFQNWWDFVKISGLESVYLGILTPYPGTRFFDQFKKEDRLLHSNWELYDTSHVVFKPKNMSAQELKDGYIWAYKKAYSLPSIFRRLRKTKALKSFVWPMNIGFNLSLRRLKGF